jgi:hypothetical protein
MATKKYLSLERLAEYDALIKDKIAADDATTLASANTYADSAVASQIGVHNASTEAHSDIRNSINALSTRVDGIVTDSANKDAVVLAEAQKYTNDEIDKVEAVVSEVQGALGGKAEASHNHDDVYYTESEIDTQFSNVRTGLENGLITVGKASVATNATNDGNGNSISGTYETQDNASAKLIAAKLYADNAAAAVKNELLNGAGDAYDTLKELGDLIASEGEAIKALETIATGKADAEHGHAIDDVDGLQAALDGKSAVGHTHGMSEVQGLNTELTDIKESVSANAGKIAALEGKIGEGFEEITTSEIAALFNTEA